MIYLDHHATTPIADEVVVAMAEALQHLSGNPGSVHTAGRAARCSHRSGPPSGCARLVGSRSARWSLRRAGPRRTTWR